jgi:hypothetical protein
MPRLSPVALLNTLCGKGHDGTHLRRVKREIWIRSPAPGRAQIRNRIEEAGPAVGVALVPLVLEDEAGLQVVRPAQVVKIERQVLDPARPLPVVVEIVGKGTEVAALLICVSGRCRGQGAR